MNLSHAEQVQKAVEFYLENAYAMAKQYGIEVDAQINVRIIPNRDKNIDADFIVTSSGEIKLPVAEQVLLQAKEGQAEENEVEQVSTDKVEE